MLPRGSIGRYVMLRYRQCVAAKNIRSKKRDKMLSLAHKKSKDYLLNRKNFAIFAVSYCGRQTAHSSTTYHYAQIHPNFNNLIFF